MTFNFIVLAVDIDESQVALESPNNYVLRIAKKAKQGFQCLDESNAQVAYTTFLAADTAVVFNRWILGKLREASNAKQMLSMLSCHSLEVLSAICLVYFPYIR